MPQPQGPRADPVAAAGLAFGRRDRLPPSQCILPNMASTPMTTRKRTTILTIIGSQSEPREGAALFDGVRARPRRAAAPKRVSSGLRMRVAAEFHLVAETLLQHRLQVADAVDQAQLLGAAREPDLAGEQIPVLAAACPARRVLTWSLKFVWMSSSRTLSRATSSGFSGRNGIQHGFGLARRVDPPLDPLAGEQLMRAEARGDHPDRADRRSFRRRRSHPPPPPASSRPKPPHPRRRR